MANRTESEIPEIAVVGDLNDCEREVTERLLQVEPGGACTLFIDSPGGSPYSGMALMSLIRLRGLQVTGVVTGECSSATLWPFAACTRRLVTRMSVLLFHPMRWQSEEHVGLHEASEWARHFAQLEREMDRTLAEMLNISEAQLQLWMRPGKYLSGPELADAGIAELIDWHALHPHRLNGAARPRKKVRS